MSWLVAILLAPVALALVVIALPFRARARGAVDDGELSGAIGIDWAFGLLGVELWRGGHALRLAGLRVVRLRGARRGRGRDSRPARKKARDVEPRKARKSAVTRLRAVTASSGRLLGMAARLAGTLHLRLRGRGRLGADDPTDTAALAGLLNTARALPGVELEVEVDWLDEVLELTAEGLARVWIPEVLVVAGLLFLGRENRAAVRALAG